jgi:hypothetical protein
MFRMTGKTNPSYTGSRVTVRLAEDSDAQILVRLAALDSAEIPAGRTLLAAVDGETVAALPLSGGRAIADPFRRTAALVELLELRAAQLRAEDRAEAVRGRDAGRLRALVRAPSLH